MINIADIIPFFLILKGTMFVKFQQIQFKILFTMLIQLFFSPNLLSLLLKDNYVSVRKDIVTIIFISKPFQLLTLNTFKIAPKCSNVFAYEYLILHFEIEL